MATVYFPLVKGTETGSILGYGYDIFYYSTLHSAEQDGYRVNYVTVTNGGSGYSSAPVVSINGGVWTTRATAIAIMGGNVPNQYVFHVQITNPGTYSSPPTSVSFSSGSATATVSYGRVTISVNTYAPAAGHTDMDLYNGHIYGSIFRGVFTFNTAELNTSTISTARITGPIGDDWVYHYPLDITDIKLIDVDTVNNPLVDADYVNLREEIFVLGAVVDNIHEIPLNANGITTINDSGLTRFGLRLQNEIDVIEPYNPPYVDWDERIEYTHLTEPEFFRWEDVHVTMETAIIVGSLQAKYYLEGFGDVYTACFLKVTNDEANDYSNVSFRILFKEGYYFGGTWDYYGDWVYNAPFDVSYQKEFSNLRPNTYYSVSVELSYNGISYYQSSMAFATSPLPRVPGISATHMDYLHNFQDTPTSQISWFGTKYPPPEGGMCEA
jgi:hypothetical protein